MSINLYTFGIINILTHFDHILNIIFITYINRSGSTYLANLLSRYDELLVCPEAEVLINKFLINPEKKYEFNSSEAIELFDILENDNKLVHWGISITELNYLNSAKTNFDAFVHILYIYLKKTKPDATTIIFKGDSIIHHFDKINHYAEGKYNVSLISMLRDIRAVYHSQKNTIGSDKKIMSVNPLNTAREWNNYVAALKLISYEENFYPIKYENLVSDPEKTVNILLKQLNLNLNPPKKEGDLYKRIPEHLLKMHTNINMPNDVSRINAWKENLSKLEIYIIENETEEFLFNNNYDLMSVKINLMRYYFYTLYYNADILLKYIYKYTRNIF